ncbi:hotdog family protein [Nocardioides pantholopis]|uniref:hypothetical protein n=1 Tax=Nocardioides pantholopis TaxID=2483798 RepID=UPI000F08F9B9|nr:hypothetical protein [Nocardioides pantholopis]
MSAVAPQVGDTLTPISFLADEVRLFCYSAVTWNPHRVHYDAPYTTGAEGYPGLLAQGPMLGGLLLRCAQEWIAGRGRIVATRYRSSAPTYAGAQLTCTGTVSARDGRRVVADLAVTTADGTTTCSGIVEFEIDDH